MHPRQHLPHLLDLSLIICLCAFCSKLWTEEVFILVAEIGMVLEAEMGGAMAGSSSWMEKGMVLNMAEKEK